MTSPQLNEQVSRADRLIDLIAPKLQLVEDELRRNFQSTIQTIHDVATGAVRYAGSVAKLLG